MSRVVCFRDTDPDKANAECRRIQPALKPIVKPGPDGSWEVERDLSPGMVAYRSTDEMLDEAEGHRCELLNAIRLHWRAKYAGQAIEVAIASEDRALYEVSTRIRAAIDGEAASE